MTERTSSNSGKTTSQKKNLMKGGNLKVKIISDTDKVLATLELEPKEFSTGSHGYYGTAKVIDWDKKQYLQVNAYAVAIGSKVTSKTKSKSEPATGPTQQQDQPEDPVTDESIS